MITTITKKHVRLQTECHNVTDFQIQPSTQLIGLRIEVELMSWYTYTINTKIYIESMQQASDF